jgi:hypothetical protein
MRFGLTFAPTAQEMLFDTPPSHQPAIRDHIKKLCEAPGKLSKPSQPPRHPPGRGVYEFTIEQGGYYSRYTILFRYWDDEQHIQVIAIGQEHF